MNVMPTEKVSRGDGSRSMIEIVEPKKHISALWSKQEVRDGETFRMMRYVMHVEHEGHVLLHNVVTGQLAVLDQEEAEVIEELPAKYSLVMEQLVDGHYLVPADFDEHQQVVKMRTILRKLDAAQERDEINHYIILPTTACNARCYYCFEHGVKTVTMTEKTANDVVTFIKSHCKSNKKVSIMWFGGEPTVAANRITQISEGLRDREVSFTSTMVSNAYLFDEEMVKRARTLWNLRRVQISVDGMENKYNEIKDYVNARDNPFERVMRNIGLLIENGIRVDLRMNFDLNNYQDFQELLRMAASRYQQSEYLQVYAYPVIGEYPDKTGRIQHGSDEWRGEIGIRLNDLARKAQLFHPKEELPYLNYAGCGADDPNAITISAEGSLVECPEHFESDQTVGTLKNGITNSELVQAWRKIADHPSCVQCTFFPRCVRLQGCSAGDKCYFQDRNWQFQEAVKKQYSVWKANSDKSGGYQQHV